MSKKYSIVLSIVTLYTMFCYAVPTTFISPNQITTAPFSITEPGLYVLTDDVEYMTSGGTGITISSNDVILDLNGKAIINSNLAGIESAISLASTHTNIIIKNGSLRVFDGSGIFVPAGVADIVVEDITVVGVNSTTGTGFNFDGIPTATTRTDDVTIKNCSASSCLHGMAATAVDDATIENSNFNSNAIGLLVTEGNFWNITSCQASLNTITSGQALGVLAVDCSSFFIRNSEFNSNDGSSSSAGSRFEANGDGVTGGHIFENCVFCDNSSTGSHVVGLSLMDTSSSIIKNCVFSGNFSTTGTAIGLSLTGSSMTINNCFANANHTLGTGAVAAQGFSSTGTNHIYRNCIASNNYTAGTETGLGIVLQGRGHVVENCTTGANASVGGIGVGIFSSSTTECLIKNCTSIGNSGNSSANSRGFQGSTAGADLWIGNIAFGQETNYFSTVIPFLTIAATGPYPIGPTFDERDLANLSFE